MATQRKFSAEEAQKKFDALPPEIKSLLYTLEVTSVIQKVGEKNRLHFDQMGVLEVETSNVMLGFTEPKDFPSILTESLHIEHTQADAITQDINDMLFVKIRESMKKMYEQNPPAEKSVIMPSSITKSSAPATTPMPILPPPVTTPAPSVTADIMLTQPTVSMPSKTPDAPAVQPAPAAAKAASPTKIEPPPPAPYKADPYREPPE